VKLLKSMSGRPSILNVKTFPVPALSNEAGVQERHERKLPEGLAGIAFALGEHGR